jgi:hypothetical protein
MTIRIIGLGLGLIETDENCRYLTQTYYKYRYIYSIFIYIFVYTVVNERTNEILKLCWYWAMCNAVHHRYLRCIGNYELSYPPDKNSCIILLTSQV